MVPPTIDELQAVSDDTRRYLRDAARYTAQIKAMQAHNEAQREKEREKDRKEREKDRKEREKEHKEREKEREEREKEREKEREEREKEREKEREEREKEREKEREESNRLIKALTTETRRQIAETWRQIREQGRQIGGIHKTIGNFSEDLAVPSLTRILVDELGMNWVLPNAQPSADGPETPHEIDMLAIANHTQRRKIIAVEIKTRVDTNVIPQMRRILRFLQRCPEYGGSEFYAMIAGVGFPKNLRHQIAERGWYCAMLNGEQWHLVQPADFRPIAFL